MSEREEHFLTSDEVEAMGGQEAVYAFRAAWRLRRGETGEES